MSDGVFAKVTLFNCWPVIARGAVIEQLLFGLSKDHGLRTCIWLLLIGNVLGEPNRELTFEVVWPEKGVVAHCAKKYVLE